MSRKVLNRRSFLRRVGGAALAGGSLAVISGSRAAAYDRDPTDPGAGRRAPSGLTDHDGRDRAGNGVGISDRDTGPNADRAGQGRGSVNGTVTRPGGSNQPWSGQPLVNDNDPTDPQGRGRGPAPPITDRDTGPGADASGHGRGPR